MLDEENDISEINAMDQEDHENDDNGLEEANLVPLNWLWTNGEDEGGNPLIKPIGSSSTKSKPLSNGLDSPPAEELTPLQKYDHRIILFFTFDIHLIFSLSQ